MPVLAGQFSSREHDAFRVPHLSDTIREAAFHRQAVKTVAYLRVSTPQQDVRSQRLAILEYARANDVRIDEFIEATASGQASEKRRRLDELTSILQRGDRLVVSELSRLGRSLGQIVTILDALAKAGVAFVALKENIRVESKRNIQTKVMTTLFALFAEVERDLISERTREGLARARASGRKLGRPKGSLGVSRLDGKEDEIRRFLELGVSKTAIAKITGVFPDRPLQLHEHPRPPADALARSVYFRTDLVGTLTGADLDSITYPNGYGLVLAGAGTRGQGRTRARRPALSGGDRPSARRPSSR